MYKRVKIGDRVQIRHNNQQEYVGHLDKITDDSIVLCFISGEQMAINRGAVEYIYVWGDTGVSGEHYHVAGDGCEDWLLATL